MLKARSYSYLNVILLSLVTVLIGLAPLKKAAAAEETLYQRVTRTNTIRCGYTSWDPLFYIDAKTGEKKGIFHDLMEEAGKRLGIKIVWQEEIGWGSLTEAIKTGRVDMDCAAYWLNPARIKVVGSSVPQIYSPLYVYMRADDKRTINKPEDLDNPQYTLTTIDGSAENQVVPLRFSHAKHTTLPELDTSSDSIQNLITKKADFLLLDSGSAETYSTTNPGKIKRMFPDTPIIMFPNVMLFPPEEAAFKNMIDNTLLSIEYDGTLDAILKKYKAEHLYLRNSEPKLRTN